VAYKTRNVDLGSLGRLLGIQLRTAGLGYLGVGSKLDRRRQAVAKLNPCATTAPSVLHAEIASCQCFMVALVIVVFPSKR
jgi:hypothetical protein